MARIEENVEIRCPIDKVFAYTTDAKSWPKWQPFPESEQTSPGPVGIGTTTKGTIRMMGLTMKWTAEVMEYKLNSKFGKDISSGAIAIKQYNIYDSAEEGTKLTIVYDIKVGGLMKPLSPILITLIDKGLVKALCNLKGILERES